MSRWAVVIVIRGTAALAALAPGCTDLDSMPTEPSAPAGDGWTLLYAPIAYRDHLLSVWAMDADDAWFGGHGFLIHFDGDGMTRHDLDTNPWIEDLLDSKHERVRDLFLGQESLGHVLEVAVAVAR